MDNKYNVLEKIGMIYAWWDCGNRNCGNCAARETCRHLVPTEKEIFFHGISEEVRALIKERDELLAKLKEMEPHDD